MYPPRILLKITININVVAQAQHLMSVSELLPKLKGKFKTIPFCEYEKSGQVKLVCAASLPQKWQ